MSKMNFLLVISGRRRRLRTEASADYPNPELALLREAFARVFPHTDTSFRMVKSSGTYGCETYIDWPGWREFLDGLKIFRGNLAERQMAVTHFVFAEEQPSDEILNNEDGFWFDVEFIETTLSFQESRELFSITDDLRARSRGRWLIMPFAERSDDRDLYEECHPNEGVAVFGRAVNVPARFTAPRAGLRLRTVSGTRLSDYVRSAYAALLLEDRPMLGGQNVIATTLFQMNDRLELVNHFNERRQEQENLNFFSLSSMQMEPVDDRDDTNVAVLVKRGRIRIRTVSLGE
jgi:hypothetical protein